MSNEILSQITLAVANFLTSGLTAITGLGGGMILIGIMPLFVPAIAIVPVHAISQLASNGTRAWFDRQNINMQYVYPFFWGSLLGLIIFGTLIRYIQLDYIPLLIGVYILLLQWSKTFNHWIRRFESFFLVGLLQTGIGVFVGTPGPLNIAVLNKYYQDNHTVVSTGALMMSIVHLCKIIAYLFLGFHFVDYLPLIIAMIIMATLGSWCGTKLRYKIPTQWLKKILPYLLTLLAIKLIISVLWKI